MLPLGASATTGGDTRGRLAAREAPQAGGAVAVEGTAVAAGPALAAGWFVAALGGAVGGEAVVGRGVRTVELRREGGGVLAVSSFSSYFRVASRAVSRAASVGEGLGAVVKNPGAWVWARGGAEGNAVVAAEAAGRGVGEGAVEPGRCWPRRKSTSAAAAVAAAVGPLRADGGGLTPGCAPRFVRGTVTCLGATAGAAKAGTPGLRPLGWLIWGKVSASASSS